MDYYTILHSFSGDTDYISLLRDDMQVRLGDTVYVLRALKSETETEVEPEPEIVEKPEIGKKSGKPEASPSGSLDDNDNNKKSGGNGNNKKSFDLGGIKHKMMSPGKGPSQQANNHHNNKAKNNYPSYKSVVNPDTGDMDIFHVERLWINNKGMYQNFF